MRALIRRVTLRHLLGEWPRTLLTLAGVALGVAVFVSIRLASHSAMASFADTVDTVAGRANLQVSGAGEGLDERVFPRVRAVPGVRAAAPVIQLHAPAAAGAPPEVGAHAGGGAGPWDATVMVLGVDVFSEGPFARWQAPASDTARAEALALLANPRAVAITGAFARRERLARGDTLSLLASGRPVALEVVQVIESREFEQAFGGSVAIVDLATAQEVFERAGRLDRIDVIADPARLDEVSAAVARVLPAGAEVETAAGRSRQVENMVRAFDLNLTALAFIAVFVAVFLIFNAVSIAVLRRRREIGMLRAVGVTRSQVARLFLLEGLLIGAVGAVLGLALGTALAQGTLGLVSRTLSDLYLVAHAGAFRPDPAIYAGGFALGLGIALLASFAPALEGSRTPPGVTLRQGSLIEAQGVPAGRLALAGLGLLGLAALAAWWTVRARQPVGGFASAFLVLAGFTLIAPGYTLALERLADGVVRRVGGIEGVLGLRYLRESIARTSVVVAALMVSVGMMVALNVMVGSFRRTVDTWITQTIRGDLYVEPIGHRLQGSATRLPPDLVEAAARLPGVAAVDTYRGTRVRLGERIAFVAGVDLAVQRDRGHLQFLRGESPRVLDRALRGDGVVVTESFARHHRVAEGDSLRLPVLRGTVALPVMGVFHDYTTDAGGVLMDRGLYARLWEDPRAESMALYLAPGADADSAQAGLARLAAGRLALSVIPNRALRERVLVIFDQTFQITWGLQTIAILVAVLGVIGTLTALVTQRGREIGVLRASGMRRAQVRRMVLVESGVLGLLGALLGCLAGMVLALLLIHVINRQFFGWSIQLHVDPRVFAQAVALMVVTAVLAGLAPARLAAGRLAAEAMRVD